VQDDQHKARREQRVVKEMHLQDRQKIDEGGQKRGREREQYAAYGLAVIRLCVGRETSINDLRQIRVTEIYFGEGGSRVRINT